MSWVRRIERRVPNCPACHALDWVDRKVWLDPEAVLPNPYTHSEMPPEFPLQGRDVFPAVCVHCGFVALFLRRHLSGTLD